MKEWICEHIKIVKKSGAGFLKESLKWKTKLESLYNLILRLTIKPQNERSDEDSMILT